MLYPQTKSYIAALDDAELTSYVQVGTAAYEAEAVSFAREEYRRRALDPRILADSVAADAARDTARTAADSRPLDGYEKAATFLKGMASVLKPWSLLLPHPENVFGERRRNRQRRRLRLAGFVATVVLVALYLEIRKWVAAAP